MVLTMPAVAADNGFVSKPSKYSVAETLDRFEAVAKAKGITIFPGWITVAGPSRWDSKCARPSC